MNNPIADIRKVYQKGSIVASKMPENPIIAFQLWLNEAINSEVEEPTAFTLSTVSNNGQPHSRVVLLKGLENDYFHFFTNYKSSKGKDLQFSPKVAMNFFWPELERQVRVLGTASKISPEKSDAYFYSRPVESQVGAIVSAQSNEIDEHLDLAAATEALLQNPEQIKRPEHWGGYQIVPHYIEFWQGRPSRVHDRVFYEKTDALEWKKGRLAP